MAANDEDIKLIPGTDFVVDGFRFKQKYNTFFLTHFHSDHVGFNALINQLILTVNFSKFIVCWSY